MKTHRSFVVVLSILFLSPLARGAEKKVTEPGESPKPSPKTEQPADAKPSAKKPPAGESPEPAAKKKKLPEGTAIPPVKKKPSGVPSQPPVKKAPAGPGALPIKKDPVAPSEPVVKKKTGSAVPAVKKPQGPGWPEAKSEFLGLAKECDENRDRIVTLAEFQSHLPAGKDPAKASEWFRQRDTNGDGSLSDADFIPLASKKQ